jgi:hypothetical protein
MYSFDSCVTGGIDFERTLQKLNEKHNFIRYAYLAFPKLQDVGQSSHWILFVVDLRKRILVLYNSLVGYENVEQTLHVANKITTACKSVLAIDLISQVERKTKIPQ